MHDCKVTILSPEYLSNVNLLKEISYWLHIAKRPQGWHYDMDEVWQLQYLEKASIPKGSTILDAGAGLGVMQYVLAARGYNVVSLDFCKREIPNEVRGIFELSLEKQNTLDYKHDYQKFIIHSPKSLNSTEQLSIFKKIQKPHFLPRLLYKVRREAFARFCRGVETFKDKTPYGKITFVRAAFHEIPFEDNAFDAIVSVSALEHADIKLLDKNVSEMIRVAKPNAPILISTSAIDKKSDFFDEKTQGWCFSAGTVSRFADNAYDEYKKYKEKEQMILQSDVWRSRIDPYYFTDPGSPFYQKGAKHLPYLPIGLSFKK